MGTRRSSQQICCCFFFLVFVNGSMTMAQMFCSQAETVIFITDSTPRDTTTFYAQRDFLEGLTQRLEWNETRLSLMAFDHSLHGKYTFRSFFSNVSFMDFSPKLLYNRPRKLFKARSAADFYSTTYMNQSRGSARPALIVAVDVSLEPWFYLMGGDYPIPYREGRTDWNVFHRVYEIFTLGGQGFKFNRIYSKRAWKNSIDEIDNMFLKNIAEFQNNFKALYDDICREARILPNALELPNHLNDNLGCHLSACSLRLEHHRYQEFKVITRFLQFHWMFVIKAHDSESIKPRNYSLRIAAQTCSREGMSLLTVRSFQEARSFGKYIRALAVKSHFDEIVAALDVVTIIIGLARTEGTGGRMFTWKNGKDLSYSYWDENEPLGGEKFGCAHWKMSKTYWKDNGWGSTRCGNVGAVILCHSEVPSKKGSMHLTLGNKTTFSGLHVNEIHRHAEIYFSDFPENKIRTLVSWVVPSGLLQYLLKDHGNITINGLMRGKQIKTEQENKQDFEAELTRLFYPCEGEKHTLGVPWSKVCDGVRDCKSGSDEAICKQTGYPLCPNNQFSCASKECVPREARCDFIRDCHDGSDEKHCRMSCPHRLCGTGRCLPRQWFHDGQVDCSDGSDESAVIREPCIFTCNRSQCVTREMLNDGLTDCKGPEGPLDEILGAFQSINCPGHNGISYLNNWAPRCVLFYDSFGEIIGCRDFAHLENCQDFVCPENYAKCPNSFCIPVSYVNDGKQDCNEGQDETYKFFNTVDIFKCHPFRSQLVPLQSICDGRKDCSHGEDELDCSSTCLPGFICLAGAISGTRVTNKTERLNLTFVPPGTRYLDISGIQVPDFFKRYPKGHFIHLIILNVSRCGINDVSHRKPISDICKTGRSSKDFGIVQKLDLSYNKIVQLEDCSFVRTARGLQELDLSHNEGLSQIGERAFLNLRFLKVIYLSHTRVNKLHINTFRFLQRLEKLSLQGTHLTALDFVLPARLIYLNVDNTNIATVSRDVFTSLDVSAKVILSSTFKVCCPQVLGPHIPRHLCVFPIDKPVFSCEDMVTERVVRVVLWLVAPATLLGNLITLVYRLTWDKKLLRKSYGLFVTNLGVSDILMGCYLVTIATADITFQGEYVLHDHSWRNSRACWAAGTMATVSSISSTLFIALITVDRFIAVRYPFGEVRFNKWTMSAAVISAWIFGISVALLPLLPFARNWTVYSVSGMCVGLPLSPKRLPGWQYTMSLFVVLNFLLFLFIGVGQGAIYKKVKEKVQRTKKTTNTQSQLYQNQRRQEIAIAKQLSLVVLSNFICWFPIITLGLITLSGIDVGEAAFRWCAIVILPVNSALNPLLYTLPAIKKRIEEFKQEREAQKALHVNKSTKEISSSSVHTKTNIWNKKIRLLKRVQRALEQRKEEIYINGSELEMLYRKIAQCRKAC